MLTLQKLEEVATEVIGTPIHLAPDQSAGDVRGWHSLKNTLIAQNLSNALGIELNGTGASARLSAR